MMNFVTVSCAIFYSETRLFKPILQNLFFRGLKVKLKGCLVERIKRREMEFSSLGELVLNFGRRIEFPLVYSVKVDKCISLHFEEKCREIVHPCHPPLPSDLHLYIRPCHPSFNLPPTPYPPHLVIRHFSVSFL